jgi:hypothetical protein
VIELADWKNLIDKGKQRPAWWRGAWISDTWVLSFSLRTDGVCLGKTCDRIELTRFITWICFDLV